MSPSLQYAHACRQGGPASLPVTWDRIHGSARVECPICGANKLVAQIHGAAVL